MSFLDEIQAALGDSPPPEPQPQFMSADEIEEALVEAAPTADVIDLFKARWAVSVATDHEGLVDVHAAKRVLEGLRDDDQARRN